VRGGKEKGSTAIWSQVEVIGEVLRRRGEDPQPRKGEIGGKQTLRSSSTPGQGYRCLEGKKTRSKNSDGTNEEGRFGGGFHD